MGKVEPLRKCLGCDEMIGKKGLLRIVKSKEGDISLDLTGKKNGRGAYICRSSECFLKARKKKSLERSLKCRIPDEVYLRLEQEIETAEEEKA
ncbi:MAG: YlxR family protein [Bacteroides sp.]|nr:YlxR family protein [Bacteroides sp.]